MGSRGPLPRPDSSTCKPLSIRGLETLQRQVAGGAEGSTAHMYQLLRMLNAVGSVKGRSHFRGVVLFGAMPPQVTGRERTELEKVMEAHEGESAGRNESSFWEQ